MTSVTKEGTTLSIDTPMAIASDSIVLDDPTALTDNGVALVRGIPFGAGVAPGTRMRLVYLGKHLEPFLRLELFEPDGPSFIVVEPGRVFDDYIIAVAEDDAKALDLVDPSDAAVFLIVTLDGDHSTANLAAPVIINRRAGIGAQVLLEDSGYDKAVPIMNNRSSRPRYQAPTD